MKNEQGEFEIKLRRVLEITVRVRGNNIGDAEAEAEHLLYVIPDEEFRVTSMEVVSVNPVKEEQLTFAME